MTYAVTSERLRTSVLQESTLNLDGDQSILSALPTNFGDVVVYKALVDVSNIATLIANPELLGPSLFVYSPSDSATGQFVGQGKWTERYTDVLSAVIEPYYPVYMRDFEKTNVTFVEVDSNAVPTADLKITLIVRRLRNNIDREVALRMSERGQFI